MKAIEETTSFLRGIHQTSTIMKPKGEGFTHDEAVIEVDMKLFWVYRGWSFQLQLLKVEIIGFRNLFLKIATRH